MHYVYILYSTSLDRFYTGESSDPDLRLSFHRAGTERFTSSAKDWVMVFKKACASRAQALRIEKKIKASKSRASIRRWIKGEDNMMRHQD